MATSIRQLDADRCQAIIDGVDTVASAMERKWGCGRLRLLAGMDLREKFDRQCRTWSQTIWPETGPPDPREVERIGNATIRGWQAIERDAINAGHKPTKPTIIETVMPDGSVLAIVPDVADASLVPHDGRALAVWTAAEVARVLATHSVVHAVKTQFPGAKVTAVRDPTANHHGLDDEIPF